MDNYEVAINGTILAAQILGIEAPEVQFFYNQNYSKRGINSIFLKEKYIIAFNIHYNEISKASLAVFSSSLKIIERVVTKTQTYAFGILLSKTYSDPMETPQFFTIDYDIAPIFDTSFPNCPALPWETNECHLMQQYTPEYLAYIPSNLREYYYIIN